MRNRSSLNYYTWIGRPIIPMIARTTLGYRWSREEGWPQTGTSSSRIFRRSSPRGLGWGNSSQKIVQTVGRTRTWLTKSIFRLIRWIGRMSHRAIRGKKRTSPVVALMKVQAIPSSCTRTNTLKFSSRTKSILKRNLRNRSLLKKGSGRSTPTSSRWTDSQRRRCIKKQPRKCRITY